MRTAMRFLMGWLLVAGGPARADSVYEKDGELLYSGSGVQRRLVMPHKMKKGSAFSVKLNPPDDLFKEGGSGGGGSGGGGRGGGDKASDPKPPEPPEPEEQPAPEKKPPPPVKPPVPESIPEPLGPKSEEASAEESRPRMVISDAAGNITDVGVMLLRARQAFHDSRFDEAISLLDQAQKVDPKNYRILTAKGSIYYHLGWEEMALEHWTRSLELHPKQPRVRALLKKLPIRGAK